MFGLESEGRGAFELSSQVGHIKLIDSYICYAKFIIYSSKA